MSGKSFAQNCFDVYFKDAFVSWVGLEHRTLKIDDQMKIHLAKKMWENMLSLRDKDKGLKDGANYIKFSKTTSAKAGSKNYARFEEEKGRVID